jgi:carbamoyl-phosphate synthase small subunit
MELAVFPARTRASEIIGSGAQGVLLSNGPGDPITAPYATETARELLGRLPIMGICLGHQLLGLALGGSTYKLPFGHHGGNHPVKDLATGKIEITSQNHNYAVAADSIEKSGAEITHLNMNDRTVEGMRSLKHRFISIQYHPEAAPGPHDAAYLFPRFAEMLGSN